MESLKRQSGVLMHVTSLPNDLGLGCFSKSCYDFVDWLNAGGFKCWQVLPFDDCGYAKSPYSSSSAFACNKYLIDITEFLDDSEIASFHFDKNNQNKQEEATKFDKALDLIYDKFHNNFDRSAFETKNKKWLEDYALFVVLKQIYNTPWNKFPATYRDRNKLALDEFRAKHVRAIDRVKFVQYIADYQWAKIKKYANERDIQIFGDMPIYVDFDSADVWSNPKNWQIEDSKPKLVSGVPPDFFNSEGQFWHNPIYDYKSMAKTKFSFWTDRVLRMSNLFDIVRIDHFIAFCKYWAIPGNSKSAKNGKWVKGVGEPLIKAIVEKTKATLVAEDLGFVTGDVVQLREKFSIPGYKVFQYGFDSDKDNVHKPHNYEKNCVACIGTHDNDTFMGLLSEGHWDKINRMKAYLQMPLEQSNEELVDNAFVALYQSSANLIVLTMQDILKLGKQARMNVPGSIENNWLWQLETLPDIQLTNNFAILSHLYGRAHEKLDG